MQRYREIMRLHILPTLGRFRLDQLGIEDVEALYKAKRKEKQARNRKKLAENTVHNIHTVLHGMLESALRKGYVAHNVANLAENKPVMERKKRIPYSLKEVLQLLRASKGHPREALFSLEATTGMREGEILGLHWRDVDLEQGFLTIRESVGYTHEHEGDKLHFVFDTPKTDSSERTIPLAPHVVETLRTHRTGQLEARLRAPEWDTSYDLVFRNGVGRPIEATNFLKRIDYPLLEQAGLRRITFHDLRHTIATLLKGLKVPTKDISELLGHASTQTTDDIYTHVLPDERVALANQIDKLFWGENEANVGQIVGQGG